MADEEEQTVERGEFSETAESYESAEADSEESLEQIAESPFIDTQSFSDSSFEVHDSPTPTLQPSADLPSPFQDNLEQSASDGISEAGAPGAPRENQQEVYTAKDETEISVANLYERRRIDEPITDNMERLAPNPITQQRIDLADFDQRRMRDNAPNSPKDYEILEVETSEETRARLPFERNTKDDYRILKKFKK